MKLPIPRLRFILLSPTYLSVMASGSYSYRAGWSTTLAPSLKDLRSSAAQAAVGLNTDLLAIAEHLDVVDVTSNTPVALNSNGGDELLKTALASAMRRSFETLDTAREGMQEAAAEYRRSLASASDEDNPFEKTSASAAAADAREEAARAAEAAKAAEAATAAEAAKAAEAAAEAAAAEAAARQRAKTPQELAAEAQQEAARQKLEAAQKILREAQERLLAIEKKKADLSNRRATVSDAEYERIQFLLLERAKVAAAEQAQREAQREAEEASEKEARELAQHEREQISGNLTRRGGKSFRAKGKKASISSSTEPKKDGSTEPKKDGNRLIGLISTRGMGSRKTLVNPNVGLHVDEQDGLLPGLHSEKPADEGRSKPKGKGILAGLVSTRGGPAAAARGRDMEPLEA
jgi:hypothetical protein